MSQIEKASKLLSYILRHKPEKLGITLDKEGWASVEELEAKTIQNGQIALTAALIKTIVETDEKGRYELSEHGDEVRAVQGHSTASVDITYPVMTPPPMLYHGTASKNSNSIQEHGLYSANRHHVHLSEDVLVAAEVGKRHGDPLILIIDCNEMVKDGYEFYLAPNQVWLIKSVPSKYLTWCHLDGI